MTYTTDLYFWNTEKEITAHTTQFIDGHITVTIYEELSYEQATQIAEKIVDLLEEDSISIVIAISAYILYVSQEKTNTITLDDYDVTIRYM